MTLPNEVRLVQGSTADALTAPTEDLDMAFKILMNKNEVYSRLYNYYDGNQPLLFSTEKLQSAFSRQGIYFAINWISVVVNSVLDRLVLKGFDTGTQATNVELGHIIESLKLHMDMDEVHESVAITEEAYIIVGQDDQGELEVYFNDPRMCHMFYDPAHPKKKRYAAKMWVASDGSGRVELYYPDRVEHWVSRDEMKSISTSKSFFLENIESAETIPVFHFRTSRRLNKRELDDSLLSIQDAINKLFSDMLIASEFNSVKQRVIISQADPGDLKTFDTWWIPAGDGTGQQSSVQELGGADLGTFLNGIKDLAASMGVISRTPKHFFFTQGGDPSGDALIAMEAPLIKKTMKKQEALADTWVELVVYIMQLSGTPVDPSKVSPTWEPAETIQPKAQAEIIKTETSAGIPLNTSVRRAGWAKDEIDLMAKDKVQERKNATSLAQEELALLRAEQNANSNSGTDLVNSTGNTNA